MLVAVEGCAHGELEQIYDCLEEAADLTGQQIELLICCGDFQATRNNHDLCSMAVPSHHRRMCSFYKFVNFLLN